MKVWQNIDCKITQYIMRNNKHYVCVCVNM